MDYWRPTYGLLRSLNKDDGDGNENGRRAVGLD